MDRRRVSALQRQLMVERTRWIDAQAFQVPTLRAACCPGRRRHSWRSSAPTRSGVPAGRSSAGSGCYSPGRDPDPDSVGALSRAIAPPVGPRRRGGSRGRVRRRRGSHCPRAVRSERRSCSTRRRPHRAMAVMSRRGSRRRRVAGRVRGTRTAQLRTDRAVVLRRRSDPSHGRGSSFVLLLPASIASGGFGALAWRLSRPPPRASCGGGCAPDRAHRYSCHLLDRGRCRGTALMLAALGAAVITDGRKRR